MLYVRAFKLINIYSWTIAHSYFPETIFILFETRFIFAKCCLLSLSCDLYRMCFRFVALHFDVLLCRVSVGSIEFIFNVIDHYTSFFLCFMKFFVLLYWHITCSQLFVCCRLTRLLAVMMMFKHFSSIYSFCRSRGRLITLKVLLLALDITARKLNHSTHRIFHVAFHVSGNFRFPTVTKFSTTIQITLSHQLLKTYYNWA